MSFLLTSRMRKKRRRQMLRATPVCKQWKQILEESWPIYLRLPEQDRAELDGHIQVFVHEKNFKGCGGLTVTDEIKISIAAQACLLLLHRQTDYYPGLQTVVVYPASYQVPVSNSLPSGVIIESIGTRAGEAWQEGAVVLAWEEVRKGALAPELGYNPVLHEFAHQIDYEDGWANGAPVLARGQSRKLRKQRYAAWKRIMGEEFASLREKVSNRKSTVLRPYGATNPAEFFAVATECFFCKAEAMRETLPELYAELKLYYQQDPARWCRSRESD